MKDPSTAGKCSKTRLVAKQTRQTQQSREVDRVRLGLAYLEWLAADTKISRNKIYADDLLVFHDSDLTAKGLHSKRQLLKRGL